MFVVSILLMGGPQIHPYPMSADSRRAILKGRKPIARRLVEDKENVGIITSKYDKSSLDVQVPEPSMFISIGQEDECTSAGSSENTELGVGDHLYARPVEIVSLSVSTQANLCMKRVSGLDDESLMMDRGTLKKKLLTDDVFKSDKSCTFYTGLSLAVFSIIFNVLKLKASSMVYWNSMETNERQDSKTPRRGPKRLLSLKEEFTLTLLRLRKGVDNKSLSDMFAISESSVSRIFTTWLCLMNVDLDFLIWWPSKDQVLEN